MVSGTSNPQFSFRGPDRVMWIRAIWVALCPVFAIGFGGCVAARHDTVSQEPNPDAADPETADHGQATHAGNNGRVAGNGAGDTGNTGVADPGVASPTTADNRNVVWPFMPTRVRIHPLSHYVPDDPAEGRVVRVRLEFVDRYGHTTKCLGQVRLELFRAGSISTGDRVSVPADAEPIGIWTFDLSDLDVNVDRYDEITRTYLVPIRPPADLDLPAVGILVARVQCQQVELVDQSYVRFAAR